MGGADEAVPVGWLDRVVEPGELMDAAMAAANALKPIANAAYTRNKLMVRQPAIDAIMPAPTLARLLGLRLDDVDGRTLVGVLQLRDLPPVAAEPSAAR